MRGWGSEWAWPSLAFRGSRLKAPAHRPRSPPADPGGRGRSPNGTDGDGWFRRQKTCGQITSIRHVCSGNKSPFGGHGFLNYSRHPTKTNKPVTDRGVV